MPLTILQGDNFSYKEIEKDTILFIPEHQQMTVHGKLTINGIIEINGALALRN